MRYASVKVRLVRARELAYAQAYAMEDANE